MHDSLERSKPSEWRGECEARTTPLRTPSTASQMILGFMRMLWRRKACRARRWQTRLRDVEDAFGQHLDQMLIETAEAVREE